MMCDYKNPPGDLGLLACANRAMSAQLTSIRHAMDGAMRAAGDLPERVRLLADENARLRSENNALVASFDAWRTDFKILIDELVSVKDRLAQERERCAKARESEAEKWEFDGDSAVVQRL
jgi:hypothetical protein